MAPCSGCQKTSLPSRLDGFAVSSFLTYLCSRQLMNAFSKHIEIMQRKFLLLAAFTFFSLSACLAQASFTNTPSLPAPNSAASNLLELDDSGAVYVDEEQKLYFIDFESLSINLSEIIVKRQSGEVVLKEDVFDLPVNTIYEIDFNQYGAGSYEIELRSFTGSIRRSAAIR
jgi:hypothetical protein